MTLFNEGFTRNLTELGVFKLQEINNYVSSVLISAFSIYLFEQYTNYRQHRRLLDPRMPEKLKKLIEPGAFEKARLYSLDKSTFNFVSQFFGLTSLAYFACGWYSKLWTLSGWILDQYLLIEKTEIRQSFVYFMISFVISLVTQLPFNLYLTFVIEKKHGFNKQTLGIFFGDKVKTVLLTILFGGSFISALIWIIRRFGDTFYFALWLFAFSFQMFVMLLFPTVIQPLFNKFDPLPDGKLKSKIEALATRLSFPLGKVLVMDGSKRSSHSNAYFFGFFSKRIVLFDTLISQNSEDEICAVLGHELGHWKCWHTYQMLAITQIHLFGLFYAFSHFVNRSDVYEAFGFSASTAQGQYYPVLIGFMLFSSFIAPAEIVVGFLLNLLSRKNEFEADRFAVKLGYGELLQSALIKLQVENKGNMNPDWMYSALNYSHPPLLERLSAIKAATAKTE